MPSVKRSDERFARLTLKFSKVKVPSVRHWNCKHKRLKSSNKRKSSKFKLRRSDERFAKLTFRPKNTLAIDSACALLNSVQAMDAPCAASLLVVLWIGDS